jgi:RNA polymerase sigma-70 factor, ECF subfamily
MPAAGSVGDDASRRPAAELAMNEHTATPLGGEPTEHSSTAQSPAANASVTATVRAAVDGDASADASAQVNADAARLLEEERALTDAARLGDRNAFRELYERNADAVARFVSRRVPSADVDDVVAEVFLRAWKARERYEYRGYRYLSWLLRIAQNLIVSRSRRPIREEAGLDRAEEQATADPAERLVDRLAGATLRETLLALPERQRLVLELRFVEDMTSAEVGDVLGLSSDAVRQLTVRSLKQVRTLLGPEALAP